MCLCVKKLLIDPWLLAGLSHSPTHIYSTCRTSCSRHIKSCRHW